MYENLIGAGVPLGPLTQPREMYAAPSGRGKIHLVSACKPNLSPVYRSLVQTAETSLCQRCGDELTDAERGWAWLADSLLSWREDAQHVLADYADHTAALDDEDRAWMVWLSGVQFRLRYHQRQHQGAGRSELCAWGQEHVAPLVDKAMATLMNCFLDADTWAARWAATSMLDSTHDRDFRAQHGLSDYPALGTKGSLGWVGQGNILRNIKAAVLAAIDAGLDKDACHEAGIRSGQDTLASMGTFENIRQVPKDEPVPPGEFRSVRELLDAAWRSAATAEIRQFAEGLAAAAFDLIDSCVGPDVGMVVGTYKPDGYARRDPRAVVDMVIRASAVGVTHNKWGGAYAVCVMPAPIAAQIPPERVSCFYGPVAADEGAAVIRLAEHLRETLGLTPEEAITTARATLIEPAA